MFPSIGGTNGVNGFMPPPMRYPVDVKVLENDPMMRVMVNGRAISIAGTASGNGVMASIAQFKVEGKKINVSLTAGTTPEQVLAALKKKLPADLHAVGTAEGFQIMRGGPARPPPPTTVEQIDTIFQNALKKDSPGKGLVTTAELRAAFKVALSTGGRISKAEKQAIARNWAATFTGAGFLATPAAQQEYTRLQQKHQLPILPVH